MPLEPLTAERRRQQTREYLLQAAAQVFAERGFYAATLDEVAAAAGFTKGAVYSNFKNKEDLFLALLEDAYAREMTALRATIESSDIPPEARIGDFVSLIGGELDRVPNMGALYLEFHLYASAQPGRPGADERTRTRRHPRHCRDPRGRTRAAWYRSRRAG